MSGVLAWLVATESIDGSVVELATGKVTVSFSVRSLSVAMSTKAPSVTIATKSPSVGFEVS